MPSNLGRAIGYRSNFAHAESCGVRYQDSLRAADFIEQREDFDLGFQFVRHGFNHQIGFARGVFHR